MRRCSKKSASASPLIRLPLPTLWALDPDFVEAVAFAWFARRTLEGLTSSSGSVTGARGARILGGVYRYG